MGSDSKFQQIDLINRLLTLPNEIFVLILEHLSTDIVLLVMPFVCKSIQNLCLKYGCSGLRVLNEWNPNQIGSKFLLETKQSKNRLFLLRSLNEIQENVPVPSDLSIHMFLTAWKRKLEFHLIYSMIIEQSDSMVNTTSSENIVVFLKLMLKQEFSSLRTLLLKSLCMDNELTMLIGNSKLDILHLDYCRFGDQNDLKFEKLDKLQKFQIKLEEKFSGSIYLPANIREFFFYRPKSDKNPKNSSRIYPNSCIALEYV